MITNFEDITHELSDIEQAMVEPMIRGFKKHKIDSPIKAPDIVSSWNSKSVHKLTEARLRKICNHIRTNGLLPLIATSKGYYVSQDPIEIGKQIKSLEERARSIQACADGMKSFL